MIRIGILGDIGSGKSYIAQNFGYPVFNADYEVAQLYKRDKKIFNKLKRSLPKYINSFPIQKSEISDAILANKNNLNKIIKIVVLIFMANFCKVSKLKFDTTIQKLKSTNEKMKNKTTDSLQFGEGNFLRAFVDFCLQTLNEKTSFSGKVNIVQPLPNGMIEQLKKQNGKYHLFQEGVMGGEYIRLGQQINCIDQMINPYQEFSNFLKLAEMKI